MPAGALRAFLAGTDRDEAADLLGLMVLSYTRG